MLDSKERSKFIFIIVTSILFTVLSDANEYHEKKDGVIYILIWTRITEEFYFLEKGQEPFAKCAYSNCFLTNERDYLKSILDFKVLIFNNVHLGTAHIELPTVRSLEQIYCMYGVEPGAYHAIPIQYQEYFNMTLTYKLSSNVTLPYIYVKNENDEIIGPKIDMHWMKLSDMNETSDYVKRKLGRKHIAAAWFVSHCDSPWRRMYAHTLQKELARYGHVLDIYGRCGTKQCAKDNVEMDECFASIESDYYFYLSFENSYGEDYVSEKLLHALEHFAVPVVFGGADYTRFMPEGIYLNANSLQPYEMAYKMIQIISDKNKYYEFFKWHDHYSFHFARENGYKEKYCELCAFLNNNINKTSIIGSIFEWWNEDQPPWPKPTEPDDTQIDLERFITGVLDLLNPSLDD